MGRPAELADRLHPYIVVSLLTGARTEELRALRSSPEGEATELVAMVRELGNFCVGVAAFPEPHPERNDHDLDARILVDKANAVRRWTLQ